MSHHDDGKLDAVFHALADATRRVILEELSRRSDQPLFEICVRLIDRHGMSLTRQAISKHLAALEESGLITTRWDGRTKLHTSNLSEVSPRIVRWLSQHKQ